MLFLKLRIQNGNLTQRNKALGLACFLEVTFLSGEGEEEEYGLY